MALEDFQMQRIYGRGGKYYITEPIWAHEKVHKQDFEAAIASTLKLKYKFKNFDKSYTYKELFTDVFKPECVSSFSDTKGKAKYQINKYLHDILNSFITKLKDIHDDMRGARR